MTTPRVAGPIIHKPSFSVPLTSRFDTMAAEAEKLVQALSPAERKEFDATMQTVFPQAHEQAVANWLDGKGDGKTAWNGPGPRYSVPASSETVAKALSKAIDWNLAANGGFVRNAIGYTGDAFAFTTVHSSKFMPSDPVKHSVLISARV